MLALMPPRPRRPLPTGGAHPRRSARASFPRHRRDARRVLGFVVAVLLGGAAGTSATPLAAQTGVTLSGAVVPYDLSGTGVTASGALRVDRSVHRMLFVQVGSAYFDYETQDSERVGLLIPELGVVLRPSTIPIYAAAGVGYALAVRGDADGDPTLWAAVGLQYGVADGWTVRPEARIRVVDPWAGSMVELSLGIQRWLGPA